MKRPCFLILLTVLESTAVERCVTSEETVNDCSCDFVNDTCCWLNKNGNNLNWTRELNYEKVMSATFVSSSHGVARLESPQICASLEGQYSLQFSYAFTESGGKACEFSAYSMNDSLVPLWETNISTGWHQAPVLHFPSFTDKTLKVTFEASKSRNTDVWCKVSVDDIVLGFEIVSSSTQPSTSPTAASPSSSSQSPSSSSSPSLSTSSPTPSSRTPQYQTTPPPTTSTLPPNAAGDKNGVPAGAIIGVVITLIVIVIVCVVVIILIRRRGEDQKGLASLIFKKFGKPHKDKEGHSSYTGEDDIIPGATNAARTNPEHLTKAQPENNNSKTSVPRGCAVNGRLQKGTSPYEIADIPDSPNYYNVPVGEDATYAVRPTNKTKTQSPDYDLATIVESGGDYSTVDDADLEERRARARPDEYAKVKKPKGGNYNKLSFQNPGFDGKADDTYNHIQDEEPVYKVPRSDGNEYSLATNPGASSVGLSAGGSSEPHYVIVNGKGKDDAARGGDDEYNHLNLRKEPSANVPDPTDRGTGDGVYNHLDDQNQGPPGVQTEDTYNRVNYDGHTQDQNRKQNAGNYSHIGGF